MGDPPPAGTTPGPAAGARPPAIPWRVATVAAITSETPRAKTYRLHVPGRARHLAGQHYIVRLTAPDGYTAQRSYSVASPPDDTEDVELTVERLDHGEVSTFLHDEVQLGDEIDVRGPIGRWFAWRGDTPAVLVGGGSGVVPLMAMLRLARRTGRADLVRLVVSVRTPDDLYYAAELPGPQSTVAYTRAAPTDAGRPVGRLTADDLAPALSATGATDDATVYICGSAGFADAASELCLALDVPAERIRVERFGPTG